MNLFSNYPDEKMWESSRHFVDPRSGKKVAFSNGGCRRGYGLKLMLLTGQTACAYCGISLVDDYWRWLLLAVDHVVPTERAKELGVREEWFKDYRNTVLSCSACNGFRNRWRLPDDVRKPHSLEAFLQLCDRAFQERKQILRKCHEDEKSFFASKPWEFRGRLT